MARTQQEQHQEARGLRKYVHIGFWLVAAGAATTLGLDLDGHTG